MCWLDSSADTMLRASWRQCGVSMSSPTLLTLVWGNHAYLQPHIFSHISPARVPNSQLVKVILRICLILYDVYILQFSVCMCVFNVPAQELCLYTLGNLWPEGAVVKEKLLVQGIVPALANCVQVTSNENLFSCASLSFFLSCFRKAMFCM